MSVWLQCKEQREEERVTNGRVAGDDSDKL